jgi:hypothetical protein
MSTPYMILNLPVPTVTLGPDYAEMNNDAFELIDSHDHSSGKGVKVKPNGMNINDNLDIQDNELENVGAVELSDLNAALTGISNANKVHVADGNLYFTNGTGTAVQITDGGSIVSTPGSASIFETIVVASNLSISISDTFVYLIVDTSVSRTITLPLASSLTPGRFYIIKDSSGLADTNSILINPSGSDTIDGASSLTMDEEYGLRILVNDGTSNWNIS